MMQKMKRWTISLLGMMVVLALPTSCKEKRGKEVKEGVELSLTSSIQGQTLRASGTAWEPGDGIGLFVVSSGMPLSTTHIYKGYANLHYVTPSGDGNFVPASSNTGGVKLANEVVDLVAYYPYQSGLSGTSLSLDLSNQSQPANIDLLYSANAKGLSATNPRAHLHFKHQLAQVQLEITGREQMTNLAGLTVEMEGLVTKGSFDLSTGTTSLGTEKAKTALFEASTNGNKAVCSVLILPGQKLADAVFVIKVAGRSYRWQPTSDVLLKKNHRYTYQLVLTGSPREGVDVTVGGSTIEDWSEEEVEKPIEIKPDEKPDVERAWYMEMPVTRDATKVQNTLDVTLHMAPDSWFGGGSTPGGERRNYSLLFSIEHRQPLWVAYPLYDHCMGGSDRSNKWDYDPKIARQFQPNLSRAYKGNPKQSRGHMLASSSRTSSWDLNVTTFYYTNMIPQVQAMNGGAWNGLETREQAWAKNQRYDTLYVVCGPVLPINDIQTVTDGNGKPVTIPTHSYKVLLHKEISTGKWYSIGVKMPNNEEPRSGKAWVNYVVPVKSLEEELGFTFFTHLDPAIAEQVKSNTDLTHFQ